MLNDCCAPCPEVQTVNVPGVEGPAGTDGADGVDGVNAYTLTTADFVVPAAAANVNVQVGNSSWMVVGQKVVVTGPAHFTVMAKPSINSATLRFEDYEGDVATGTNIPTASAVGPSGTQPSLAGLAASGANSDITSLTGLTTPLSVAQGGTGGANVGAATRSLLCRERLLGLIIGADMNSTDGQAIGGLPSKYTITKILVTNASISLTTAAGGFYFGQVPPNEKTGTAIVAAAQVYSALTAASKKLSLTLTATIGTDVLTAATIYLSLTTAQGAPATADVYVFGEDLAP